MQINGLIINNLTMRNFLSVGNATQTVVFDSNDMTLVLGQNNDSNGSTTRNGAGKTSILQALSFVLYGQPLTKIKIDNLINNINLKSMYVTVDFEKNGIRYRIERGRKPNIMRYYIDGQDVTEKDEETLDNNAKGDNTQTQQDINRVIGMSHMMFKHIVALNTYTDPFLKEGAAKQREIIEELLGVTQISARADALKIMLGTTKDRVKALEATLTATRAANTRIEKSIEKARDDASRWERDQDAAVHKTREQLELTKGIDFESELSVFDQIDAYMADQQRITHALTILKRELTDVEREIVQNGKARMRAENVLSGNTQQTIDRLTREITRYETSLARSRGEVNRHIEHAEHFARLLENPGEQDCKTCGQALQGTDHLNYVIKRFEDEKKSHEDMISSHTVDIETSLREIDGLRKEISNVTQDHEQKVREAIVELSTIANMDNNLQQRRTELRASEQVQQDELKKLNGKPETIFGSRDEIYSLKFAKETLIADLARLEDAKNPFIDQINGLRTAIQKIDMEPINQETETLKHQEFLFKLLTSKDSFIRRKIVEQNLAFLNSRMHMYLEKLGLPHSVIFQSDLSVVIELIGRDLDFGQLSRGESNRVIMATSWAFRDVWESMNHPINLIFVDEYLDMGGDMTMAEAGLQVLHSFGRNGRNVFLISHRDELIGKFENILMVSKVNGFTSIIMS